MQFKKLALALGLIGGTLATPVLTTAAYANCADPAVVNLGDRMGAIFANTAMRDGVMISGFTDQWGTARSAGLEMGDVIVAGNGTPIYDSWTLINVINDARRSLNGVVNLTVRDVRTGGYVYLGVQL